MKNKKISVNRFSSTHCRSYFKQLSGLLAGLILISINAPSLAESYRLGADTCGGECHQAELEVWQNSPHQASFEKFDDPSDELTAKVDKILEAVGDDDMTESSTCTICHFNMIQDDAGEEPYADSGPACESCHGAGSEFVDIHSDQDVDYDARMAKAESMGMIRPHMKFDIAQNCNGCHAMARPEISGDKINAMLSAGHPINPKFELVRYSQGAVRHRFYAPDTSVNAKMTPAELANLYVEGQIAQLLAAHNSLAKSPNAEYAAAMQQRKQSASAALAKVDGSAAFVANPTEAAARALVKSIAGKDLSSAVGSMLPDPGTYKQ
ncbi:MAG: hypothetical protein HKN50_07245 [Gammaproteobacteria bacterium]|nr:hypothetical protein [Gammaproteobacteria bacterium]